MHVRSLCFLLIFISAYLSRGQVSDSRSFELLWEQQSIRSTRHGIDASVPVIRNQGHDATGLPTYSASFNVQNNGIVLDYQIIDVKFSSISSQELAGINPEDIPSSLEPKFSLSRAREKTVATVVLNPLVRQEGQVRKVMVRFK